MRASKPRATPKIVAAADRAFGGSRTKTATPRRTSTGTLTNVPGVSRLNSFGASSTSSTNKSASVSIRSVTTGWAERRPLPARRNACRSGATAASLPVGCSSAGPFSSRSRNRAWSPPTSSLAEARTPPLTPPQHSGARFSDTRGGSNPTGGGAALLCSGTHIIASSAVKRGFSVRRCLVLESSFGRRAGPVGGAWAVAGVAHLQ